MRTSVRRLSSTAGRADSQGILYRTPLKICEVRLYGTARYPVCPRCQCTLDREYQNYCDRCGQALDWREFDQAIPIAGV